MQRAEYIFRYESFASTYWKCTAEKLFIENKIYLNSRTQFNDPFDFSPKLVGKLPIKVLRKRIKPPFSMTRNQRRIAEKNKNLPKIAEDLFDQLLDDFGIKSFSTINDNLLLWSHYADGHAGYCVKFKPIESELKNFVYVQYEDTQITIDRKGYFSYDLYEKEKLKKALFTKSKDWQYENECRIIKNDSAKKYEPFQPNELVEVYFGLKCKQDYIDFIKSIISNKNVKLFKCHKHPTDFKILFEPIL